MPGPFGVDGMSFVGSTTMEGWTETDIRDGLRECVPFPAFVDGEPVTDYVDWLRFSFLATATGLPAIVLPAGFTASGMPAGIQLVGPPRGEARLLQVARAVEAAVGFPRRPIDPIVRHI